MKQRLSLLLSLVYCSILIPEIFSLPAIAQVTSDGTTQTVVNANGNNFTIQQGDRAGNNLFHSFIDFSVPNGGAVFFNNATDIVNIFSRVTGGNISNIDGLLRANGNANLFLLNPAGIIFGEGASLDLGGSFLGSTAESLLFEDGNIYSATNPTATPLLTINVPVGLQYGSNPNPIEIRGSNLPLASGQNLTLAGGDLNSERRRITAPGGRVELGGLSVAGTVTFNDNGSLNFPEDVPKADINLRNATNINVSGTGGGSIIINARNLNLEAGDDGRTAIRAGITINSISPEAIAGDITINVTDTLTVEDSAILNTVNRNQVREGVGNAGDITITTGSLTLSNGGLVSASTFGQGNAGSVKITATDSITIDGENTRGNFRSSVISHVGNREAAGNAGDVIITTGSLTLSNGGRVSANTVGQGNAGSVKITANDSITIDSEKMSNNTPSGAFSQVRENAKGQGGDVIISTGSLNLSNGGQVDASTFGQGDAGSVEITATDSITIDGTNSTFGVTNSARSGATSIVRQNAEGQGGNVIIDTGSLTLSNGGQVDASTIGKGDAGSVEINADSILVDGKAINQNFSRVSSQVRENAQGNGGDIIIDADSITLTNGGRVSVSTNSEGNGGNIVIATDSLNLIDAGVVAAVTFSEGNGGNVTVQAKESINITGATSDNRSGLYVNALISNGNGGEINVLTDRLTIDNGGTIEASNFEIFDRLASGTGEPGNINIEANSLSLTNQARIDADGQSETGNQANINLKIADRITLGNSSFISAQARGLNANGGNIDIDTNFIIALPNQNNDILANAGEGEGGNINLTAKAIFGLKERSTNPLTNDIDASSDFGVSGTVVINNPDVDPTSGLVELPDQAADPSDRIIAGCAADSGNSFTITGSGGLPEDPTDTIIRGQNLLSDLRDFTDVENGAQLPTVKLTRSRRDPLRGPRSASPLARSPQQFQDASVQVKGWFVNSDGEVELVAALPQENQLLQNYHCQDIGN